jgi:hypothetical protein
MPFNIMVSLASFVFAMVVVFGQGTDGDCKARTASTSTCVQTIYSTCVDTTFTVDRRAYAKNCSSPMIFWDTPMGNMALLFESNILGPYELCLKPYGCTNAFRTTDDGNEVAITWDLFNQVPVCFNNNRTNRPTMKFRFYVEKESQCYGTFIPFFYR